MKKLTILSVLGLFLSGSVLAFANTSVQAPATFTLKFGEKVTVANYQSMQIELLESLVVQPMPLDAPSVKPIGNAQNTTIFPLPPEEPGGDQPISKVSVRVTTPGGCGPNADPRCLGAPAFSNTFTIAERGSVNALGLKIEVKEITSASATFAISVSREIEPPILPPVEPPTPCPLPAERQPQGVIAPPCPPTKPLPPVEPGLPGVVEGNPGLGSGSGTVAPGGPIEFIICPNGAEGENCSVCADGSCAPSPTPIPCLPPESEGERPEGPAPMYFPCRPIHPLPPEETQPQPMTQGASPVPQLSVVQLGEGETLVSAKKLEAPEESDTVTYEVKAKKTVRLLFVIPIAQETTYSVDAKTGASVVVSRPWWSFLAW